VEPARSQRFLILLLGTILLTGTGAARAATFAPGGRSLAGAAPSSASRLAGGAAVAFGENYFGELGTFYKDKYEPSPVPVEGLTNITEVAGSASFNLALLSDGTVASWGGNGHGQLGDNRKKPNWEEGAGHAQVEEESPSTHEVTGGLHGVRAVAVANEHAMALMDDGTVMAWGNDEYGQLGNGTQGFERQLNINERLPKAVPGLQNIRAIAAGGGSDYALTSAGTVLAWGDNTEGQLGLGQPGPDHCETAVAHYPRYELCSERPLPVVWTNPATGRLEELTEVQAVYAGEFAAYALLPGGRLVSWGGNRHGELGTGAETWPGSELPAAEVRGVDGASLTNVAELAPGSSFALARLEDGEVLGWGSAAQGDLAGVWGEECRPEGPQQASGSRNARSCVKLATRLPALERLHPESLSAGRHYGLALAAGAVYAWGSNERGQLGSGKVPRSGFTPAGAKRNREGGDPTPKRVEAVGPAAAVLAAGTHSVVLLGSGVAPPPPLVSAVPEPLAVNLSWQPETATGQALVGERLLYRVSERTGEPEPAEQGSSESEEGPPVNLPEEPAYLTLAGEPVGIQALVVGEKLTAEPGAWSGARPITFAYQWQRCNAEGEACSNILGAHHPGYFLVEADIGSTVRAIVTATGPEAKSTAAPSAATAPVNARAEGEGARNAATSVKLSRGLLSFRIDRTVERAPSSKGERHPRETSRPLQAVPYEVKFTASKRVRVMVLTPLEEATQQG
jgi:alpha-tubulin suppressor-like RCC1 family protein